MSQEFNGITYTSSIDCLRAQVEYWKERAEKAEQVRNRMRAEIIAQNLGFDGVEDVYKPDPLLEELVFKNG